MTTGFAEGGTGGKLRPPPTLTDLEREGTCFSVPEDEDDDRLREREKGEQGGSFKSTLLLTEPLLPILSATADLVVDTDTVGSCMEERNSGSDCMLQLTPESPKSSSDSEPMEEVSSDSEGVWC